MKWTIEDLKHVSPSLGTGEAENGAKSCPLLDHVEVERFVFPALHVTPGLAN
jgi:hypothetical protein